MGDDRPVGAIAVGTVRVMAQARLNRDEFYDKLSGLDEAELKKAWWTLYWRGSATVRERVDAAIDPPAPRPDAPSRRPAPDPDLVLAEVTEFAALARKGAYLAGDRRVSPRERTRWRLTFRRLATQALDALGGDRMEPAAAAVSVLVDLACETKDVDYFRSGDPVEAARFVVSDAVRALWVRSREAEGGRFAPRAAEQLLRWESEYGWTRRGDGWVAARETSLARVLTACWWCPTCGAASPPTTSTPWTGPPPQAAAATPRRRGRRQRAEDLRERHATLVDRLVGSEHEELLDRLVTHPALSGPEVLFLQARFARARGDLDAARDLARRSLAAFPGHREFQQFATEIGA